MKKAFGCTNNLLLLPVSGAFVILLGILLIILYFVTRGLTTSLYFIEGPVPNFVPAILLISSGALTAALYIKPARPLIFVSFILGLACIILSSVQAVTTLVIYLPFLNSFSICVEKPTTFECQCYVVAGSVENKTIVTDENSVHYTFQGTSTCVSIERTLKDFLYIICIVYVFGLVACLFTTVLSILLWCCYQPPEKEIRETAERTANNQEDAVAGSSAASDSRDPVSQQSSTTRRENPSGQARVEEVRTVSTGRSESQRRRPVVQRSSSITTGQSNPAPRITRHHSVATADTSPPDQNRQRREGSNQGRPRMPHVLIRGGYLQSQLDGPTIPVYTLQGSNEAYISLTDLPSLQMPSLESVPAFIPEVPEPMPDEEPPPYSPEPQRFSPRQEEGDSALANGEEGGDRSNTVTSNGTDHVQVISQETVLTQNVGNFEETAPRGTRSDCPPSTIRSSGESHSSLPAPDTNQPGTAGRTVDETLTTSSVPKGKSKSVTRKPSGSQPLAGKGGGRSTPLSDGSRSEDSVGLPDGKKVKVGNVREEQKRTRREREQLKEVGNIISSLRNAKYDSREATGGRESNQDASKMKQGDSKAGSNDYTQNAPKNRRGDERTSGVKTGEKGGTRRKVPTVPEDNPAKIADKKQRIKEQVLMTEKNRSGKNRLQSDSEDNSKKIHGKAGSHRRTTPPDKQTLDEKREKSLGTKDASGAKPKVRRKKPRGPSVEEVKNFNKNSNGSSHESLSEIVGLLESVRGGHEKKSKRRRSSGLDEFNFPDSHV